VNTAAKKYWVVDTKLLSFFEDFKTFYVLGNKAVVARNKVFFFSEDFMKDDS